MCPYTLSYKSSTVKFSLFMAVKQRLYTLLSLAVIVPLGLLANAHREIPVWVNNSSAGLLYVVFWCLFFYLLFPKARVWKIIIWVFLVTCLLELLQLWHPPFLVPVRETFMGKTLLGTSFSFLDMVYYVQGCLIAWLWIKGIQRLSDIQKTAQ